MKQTVSFEKPNTLVLKLRGELLPDEAVELNKKVDQLLGGVGVVKVLIDVREFNNIQEFSSKLSVSKMAMIGASARVRMLGLLMLKMIPYVKKAKYFKTEEEARAWLGKKT
jgi:hypothetical protein